MEAAKDIPKSYLPPDNRKGEREMILGSILSSQLKVKEQSRIFPIKICRSICLKNNFF